MSKVRVLQLTPDIVLMEYGEYRDSKLMGRRLRYLRTADSRTRTDVMLLPTHEPPR
jgi:hypothetical protein